MYQSFQNERFYVEITEIIEEFPNAVFDKDRIIVVGGKTLIEVRAVVEAVRPKTASQDKLYSRICMLVNLQSAIEQASAATKLARIAINAGHDALSCATKTRNAAIEAALHFSYSEEEND